MHLHDTRQTYLYAMNQDESDDDYIYSQYVTAGATPSPVARRVQDPRSNHSTEFNASLPSVPPLHQASPSFRFAFAALEMVVFFSSNTVEPHAVVYMGKDKVESSLTKLARTHHLL